LLFKNIMNIIKQRMTFKEICNIQHFSSIMGAWDQIVEYGLPSYENEINMDGEKTIKLANFLPVGQKYLNKLKKSEQEILQSIREIDTDYISSRKEVDHLGNQYEGRVYADKGISLINFPKSVRNLCLLDKKGNPLIVDIDIKNAHGSIWLQYLLKNKYPVEQLQYFRDYCKNRSEWIEYYNNIYPELEPKVCIITAINGGDIPYIDTDFGEEGRQARINITKACIEIQRSLQWIKEQHALTSLDQIKKFVYSTNTQLERQIINIVLDYCKEQNIIIRIYAYDGLCIDNTKIKRTDEWVQEFMTNLSKLVFERMNYVIEFTHKKFSIKDKPIQELLKIITTMPKRRSLDNEIVKKLEPDEYISDVCEDDLNIDKLLRGTITVLKASMGLGKSQALYQIFKKLGKRTIISILNRISLIQAITTKYDWTKSYLDNENSKINGVGECTIICSESLHRFTQETLRDFNNDGVLVLDELTSVLPQMMSQGTHGKNLHTNQLIFWSLIRNAPYIFITDANISQKTLDFIKEIRKDGPFEENTIFKNIVVEPRKSRSVKFYKDQNLYIEDFKQAVQSGKKLYVPSTISVLKMTTILQYSGAKYLYINQDNRDTPEIKEYIKHPERWTEFDVVCISPTITSGISCDVKDYFDETWCFFTKNTSSPFDSCQMIDRVRNIKSELVHIHIQSNVNQQYPKYLTKKQILKLIYNNQSNVFHKNFHPDNLCDIKWNYDTYQKTLILNPKFELFSHVYSTLSYEYMFFQKFLITGLKESYIIKDIDFIEEETEKSKELVENLVVAKEERATEILFAPMITDEEAQQLEDDHKTNDPKFKKYNLVRRLSSKGQITDDDINRFEGLVAHKCPIAAGLVQGQNDREVQTCLGSIEKYFIPQFKCIDRIFSDTDVGLNNGLDLPKITFDMEATNDTFTLTHKDDRYGTPELRQALKGFRSGVLDTQYVLTNPDFFGLEYIWQHTVVSNEDMIKIERAIITDLFKKDHKDKLTRYIHNFKLDDNFKKDVKNYNCMDKSKIDKPQFLGVINSIVGHVGMVFRPIEKKEVRYKKPDGKWSKKRINGGFELGLRTPLIFDTTLPIPELKSEDLEMDVLPVLNRPRQRLLLTTEGSPRGLLKIPQPDEVISVEDVTPEDILDSDYGKSVECKYTDEFISRYKNSVFFHLQN